MEVGGVVLCGGQSLRMGRSKAWLPFGPERLVQRAVRLVGEAADPVVVVAAPGQAIPPLPSTIRVVRDEFPGRGPLQGLATGLEALGGVTFAFGSATDVPLLVPAWIARLAALIGDADLALPRADGRLHPLSALYRRSTALPAIHRWLASGGRRPTDLPAVLRTRFVEADELRGVDPNLDTLANLNTPEEYRLALRRAGLPEGDPEGLFPL